MRRTAVHLSLGLAAVTTLGSAVGASAADAPTHRTERVYFHCTGPTKATNANQVTGSGIPGWNTTAPTASVAAGAGCGTADPAGANDGTVEVPAPTSTDAVWTGTFTGNLSSLTVEAHSIYVGTARTRVQQYGITPVLFVDGQRIVTNPGIVNVTPVASSTGASEKILFTITSLDLTEDRNSDGVPDAGTGTTARKITLQLRNQYVNTNGAGSWVFDSTEVPAGITFNPSKAEAVSVPRA